MATDPAASAGVPRFAAPRPTKRTCEDTPFVQVLPGSRSPCVKVRARYDFAVTLPASSAPARRTRRRLMLQGASGGGTLAPGWGSPPAHHRPRQEPSRPASGPPAWVVIPPGRCVVAARSPTGGSTAHGRASIRGGG